ncbi:MAG TPA: TIGR02996 domain-containing protein [Gemmataceae bacterium]|jgi:uncharacterized protein (TIGR02996 family)|nr:TIGR02996 domain-containing protein [Gemmataceae bacterium]
MTDEDIFLQAIRENPDDDGARLIYADWLEEQGDPRGELIRVQCALARMPAGAAGRRELEERERQLLREVEAALSLPAILSDWEFHRGLLESASIRLRAFAEHAEALVRLGPLRRLHVFNGWFRPNLATLQALASNPYLARVTSLELTEASISAQGVRELTASPYLEQLTALDLSSNVLGDEGVQVLAGCPSLARLTRLALGGNLIGDDGAQALADSPYLTNLTTLDLSRNSITDQGLAVLAASPRLAQLTALDLSNNLIADSGVSALAETKYLTRLTALNLRNNFIGDRGVQALARAPFRAQLLGLDLQGNFFTADDGGPPIALPYAG